MAHHVDSTNLTESPPPKRWCDYLSGNVAAANTLRRQVHLVWNVEATPHKQSHRLFKSYFTILFAV